MLWRGKGILPPVAQPERLAGSHLDILPTLIELARRPVQVPRVREQPV